MDFLTRYIKRILNFARALPYRATHWDPGKDQLIIVTGADSSHFKSLCQFLSSVMRYEPDTPVIVYDLGLEQDEQHEIRRLIPKADYRIFDYASYPDHFNIQIRAGEYAWKPVIIHEVLNEFKCCVCWMDAGNLITDRLTWIRRFIKKSGLYAPRSMGTISEWTHPGTLKYLRAPNDLLQRRNLNGACVAVSYEHQEARALIRRWKECAMIKDCIAPEGSNRKNHRQDQAVLSVLAHQSGISGKIPPGKYGFKTQQDVD